ncbi:LysE family translocator [Bacillus mycoides]
MIVTLFTYILLGLSLSIPAGAMTVQMTKQGMRNGFVHGWFVGIGGMTVDLSLIVLIYLGFSSVLTNPWVEAVMWLLGFGFLMFIGIESIKEAKSEVNIEGEDPNKSLLTAYLSGFMIAISPANIVFWIGVFGPVLVSSFKWVSIFAAIVLFGFSGYFGYEFIKQVITFI